MSAPTVRISKAAHHVLKALSRETGRTMTEVLDQALEAYRRKLFFEQMNAGYAELRADPEAWAEHEAERETWDVTLMDGLDPEGTGTAEGGPSGPARGKAGRKGRKARERNAHG